MGVYNRGSKQRPLWWVSYAADGKVRRESVKNARTKAEAEAYLAKVRHELFVGANFPQKTKSGLTVGGLRDMWLEKASNKRSLKADVSRFKTLVELLGEDRVVAKLRPSDLNALQEALRARGVRGGGTKKLAPASIRQHLVLFKAALAWAFENGHEHKLRPHHFKVRVPKNSRERVCSMDEFQRLVGSADPELRLAIYFGYYTGMRQGEIMGLNWAQVDLALRILRVDVTKTDEPRTVPIARPLVDELKRVNVRPIAGPMFSMSANEVSKRFRNLARKVGIEGLRYHDLRHTYLTNLAEAGVDLKTLQMISGHKQVSMLMRYINPGKAHILNAVDKAF